ncbi:MAG: energy-coupling factor transporter ATPase [Anaerovoracaceae bacterium]|nr:energy-coupling factor transporter ATPase [Anaerovoracaceae bacterium]
MSIMERNNIIEIKNLVFEYIKPESGEKFRALDDVSMSVEEGSFVAVIGRNGSGKSTIAKCMNALLLPADGSVVVGGWDTTDEEHVWDIRQTAGMVFQNPDNQIVSAIVEDDVAFGPENLDIEPAVIRQRVDDALDSVKMGPYRKKAPHLLSGGQKQRIAIAGAVAMRPKCIIFDEPTAMLDPSGRRDIMEIIRKLHREGITVVLITHFMEEAAQADRIVILDRGRIAMDGTPQEVFSSRQALIDLSLDVPVAVEIRHGLAVKGIDLSEDIVDEDELVEAVCRYK